MICNKAQLKDIDELERIVQAQSFSAQWTKEDFKNEIIQSTSQVYCIWEGSTLVGFIALRSVLDFSEIINLAIAPMHCKKGYASLLLSQILNANKKSGVTHFTLEVHEHNHPAISLYKKFGFTIVGIRKGFYEDGNNALVMELNK